MVVRPSSERLSDAGRCRTFPPDTTGRKALRPEFQIVHRVHPRRGMRTNSDFARRIWTNLVEWANIIDGAQYPDAKTAVELGAPAMKLTLVIEGSKGSGIVQKIIGWMQRQQLAEIVERDRGAGAIRAALPAASGFDRVDRRRARQEDGGVVYFDLTGYEIEGYNKFIPYYLFPECTYTVSVMPRASAQRSRWDRIPGPRSSRSTIWRQSASVMAAAGMPRVGAISLEPGALEKARAVAAEIVTELKG